jgi:DNA replication and repair protein RecF
MELCSIKIVNFRNYKNLFLNDFGKTNLLYGENGSGKSNFLEAIHLLSHLTPIRKVAIKDLINWEADTLYIMGEYDNSDTVEVGIAQSKRMLKINNNPALRNKLPLRFPCVAFLTDDTQIITGSPDRRRNFIDISISQISGDYYFALSRYNRALRQRNAQLKISAKQATIWNKELVKWGTAVIDFRQKFIRMLNRKIAVIYGELYGKEPKIRYLNTFKLESREPPAIESSFYEALSKTRIEEARKLHTIIGPHRDNFDIKLDGQSIPIENIDSSVFASQGQLRSLAIALKMGVLQSAENKTKTPPIVLLDDVLLELDRRRREKVLSMILPSYQSFITATSRDFLTGSMENSRVFRVNQGRVIMER